MTTPLCPLCGAPLSFEDRLIDTETMLASVSSWHCNGCQRFFDDDDLAEIQEIGIEAFLAQEDEFERRVLYGDAAADNPESDNL